MDVKILCVDAPDISFPVAGYVIGVNIVLLHQWYIDGKNPNDSELDLIEVKEKKVVWVNIYKSKIGHNEIFSFSYSTKKEADESASTNRIACVKVEYENGDGL